MQWQALAVTAPANIQPQIQALLQTQTPNNPPTANTMQGIINYYTVNNSAGQNYIDRDYAAFSAALQQLQSLIANATAPSAALGVPTTPVTPDGTSCTDSNGNASTYAGGICQTAASSNTMIMLVLLAVGGLVAFFLMHKKKSDAEYAPSNYPPAYYPPQQPYPPQPYPPQAQARRKKKRNRK